MLSSRFLITLPRIVFLLVVLVARAVVVLWVVYAVIFRCIPVYTPGIPKFHFYPFPVLPLTYRLSQVSLLSLLFLKPLFPIFVANILLLFHFQLCSLLGASRFHHCLPFASPTGFGCEGLFIPLFY